MNILRRWYLQTSGAERISPNDWVKPDQISYEDGFLVVALPEVRISGVADTGSMDGTLDYGHTVILIKDFDKDKLSAGDIVGFQVYTDIVLHRIVETGKDGYGLWYHTRGDNCISNDPYRLRKENIIYLCVGVFY